MTNSDPDAGLRKIIQDHLPHFHTQAIETGGTGRGILDLNYCYTGKEGWIECKRGKGVYGDGLEISAEQIGWAERRARAGGRIFLAVRRQALMPRYDEFWLFGVGAFRDKRLEDSGPALYTGEGGPARWDWASIARILLI